MLWFAEIYNKGNLVLAWVEQTEPESPILGEAKAALCAIRRAAREGYKRLIVEGYAWNVIKSLVNPAQRPHWSIASS